LFFYATQAVDADNGNLNEAAIERVEWVITHAKRVQLGGIDIDQFQSKYVSESEQRDMRLAQLLSKAFFDRGIRLDHLKTQTGLHPEKPAMSGAYATVDAYTK
jgi:hypothetical protein